MDMVLVGHSEFVYLLYLNEVELELTEANPGLNTSPETQLKEFGNRTDLTIKWVLQLVMAIECDAFVGTRGVSLCSALPCIIVTKNSLDGIVSSTPSVVYGSPHANNHSLKLDSKMIG
jgi:hypothetical protein